MAYDLSSFHVTFAASKCNPPNDISVTEGVDISEIQLYAVESILSDLLA
jgi:hypothetical protein